MRHLDNVVSCRAPIVRISRPRRRHSAAASSRSIRPTIAPANSAARSGGSPWSGPAAAIACSWAIVSLNDRTASDGWPFSSLAFRSDLSSWAKAAYWSILAWAWLT